MISTPRKLLTAAILSALAWPAGAQETGGEDGERSGSLVMDRLTVTAQRREERAQDVPISITAYDGAFLESIGVEQFFQLAGFVPGVEIQEQSPNNPGFVIRGITSDSGAANFSPRVSVFLDGVDVSRSRGTIFELFDIERVEVLKGPQSTLFGSAASIGAISIISAKPQDEFSAEVGLGFGNFAERRAEAMFNAPLIDGRLFARVAAIYRKRDGFIDNIACAPGSLTPDPDCAGGKLNGKDTAAIRFSLRALLGDATEATLVFNHQEDKPPGTSFKSGTIPPTGGTLDPFDFAELGPRGDQLGIDREVSGVTLLIDHDFGGGFSLHSNSAWRGFDSLESFDADGFGLKFLDFKEDAFGRQRSQDLRLNYDGGRRFQAFGGLSYFYERGYQRVPFETNEQVFFNAVLGTPFLLPNGQPNLIRINPFTGTPVAEFYSQEFSNFGRTESWSAYLDGTFGLTDRLFLTLGGRYISEDKDAGFSGTGEISSISFAPLLPVDTGGQRVTGSDSFSAFNPRILAQYFIQDNFNIYASAAEGRRAEVIDVTPAGSAVVPAEEIWNYELGFKWQTDDARLSLEGAVFRYDYTNFQTTVIDPDTLVGRIENAGSASGTGAELAVRGRLGRNFEGFANASWLDASFDDFDEDGNPIEFAGNTFRLTPEWSGAVGLSYFRPLGNLGRGSITATWNWRSSVFFEDSNDPRLVQGAYGLASLRAGLTAHDNRWQIVAYVDNLFDKQYLIDAGNTGDTFGIPTFIPGNPRFFGIQGTYRFF